MVNLVIDFGNTRTKAAIFEKNELKEKISDTALSALAEFRKKHSPEHTFISSVKYSYSELKKHFGSNCLYLDHNTPLPFLINYKTPHTLGLDRIAAVAGAQQKFPNKNCLVIDSGTCITYDYINEKGEYIGGGISPGIQMRFKSLNTFTANLPLVKVNDTAPLIGTTTDECIQSGVINGVIGEIEQIIRMYSDKFADLQIIICGGDAEFFENKVKAGIFAAPELVLTGLNRILIYNVQKNR